MSVTRHTSREGITTITFSSEKHNSLPSQTLQSLRQTINDCSIDERTKVIILQSEGDRTFCAGASFDELIAINNQEEGLAFFSGFANVINACRTSEKIIIGRLQGKAVGGGVGIASACDVCYATKYAAIRLSELAVGIGPFVIGPAVQRKIGLAAFSEMALDASSWKNAYWVKDKGLYAEVFDNVKDMDEKIETLALSLCTSNPDALTGLKSVFWEGTDHWDTLLKERAAMSGQMVLSDFSKEAINSFRAK